MHFEVSNYIQMLNDQRMDDEHPAYALNGAWPGLPFAFECIKLYVPLHVSAVWV